MKINLENYEEFALDYLENNLNEIEHRQFEFFLQKHPDIKKTFENFELITLPEFNVEFRSKEKLLKYERKYLYKIPRFWIKAAAVIFLPLSFFVLTRSYLKMNPEPSLELHVLRELPMMPPSDPNPEILKQLSEVNMTNRVIDMKVKLSNPNIRIEEIEIKPSPANSIPELTEIALNQEDFIEERILPTTLSRIDDRIFTIVSTGGWDVSAFKEIIYPIEKESDGWNKLGKFLAKSNLMPLGLEEEWSSIRIKDRFLPESLLTNAN